MNALVWFNNDLRVQNNPSLQKAQSAERIIGVYFFDPRSFQEGDFGFIKTHKFRARFLIESVHNLRKNLADLNITLQVYFEKPELILPDLVKDYDIDSIFLQAEWTRDETKVLHRVKSKVNDGIDFVESYGQFLVPPIDMPYNSYQEIPDTFTTFRKRVEAKCNVSPLPEALKSNQEDNLLGTTTTIPKLEDLGFEPFEFDKRAVLEFKGGEDSALERIRHYLWDSESLATYKKTRNNLMGADYSSKFSPWLANGSLSPKMIYWEVKSFEKEVTANESTYWMVFELLWRDYFKYVSLKYGNKIFKVEGIMNKSYSWNRNKQGIENWINGKTEEPFVNANMLELHYTGWMSNRGRQNVASYFTKELNIDWRIGAAYFESMLIDYDVHSNWGNWMYVSGVGNDSRDRKFNIERQAKMYDPDKKFQYYWLSTN